MADDYDMENGMNGAGDALDGALGAIWNAMDVKMEKACATVELDAKKNCPVESGVMRAGITHKVVQTQDEIDGVVGVGGPHAEAAVYVHQGTGLYAANGDGRKEVPWRYKNPLTGKWYTTSGQRPNPFLQKAVDDNRDKIGTILAGG